MLRGMGLAPEEAGREGATTARYFWRMRSRLVVLVLLSIIPALGLLIFTTQQQRRLAIRSAEERALALSLVAVANEQRVVDSTRSLLTSLGSSAEVVGQDVKGCSDLAAQILARNPGYLNLGAATAEGDLFCSALPFTSPVSLSDRLYYRRAIATKDFAAGEYQVGRVTGKPSLNFGYPVLDARGEISKITFAAVDVEFLSARAATVPLPEASVLVIVDQNGTVLARSRDAARFVGKTLPDAQLFRKIGTGSGVTEARGPDGVLRIYSYAPLAGGAAHVAVGFDRARALADVDRLFQTSLIAMGIVAVVALIAAWVLGELLVVRQAKTRQKAERELNLIRNEFLSVISHDLRSPLATIAGYADLLLIRDVDAQRTKEFVGIISRTAKSLARLIEDVFQVSLMESGDFSFEIAPFDLGEVARRVVSEAADPASSRISVRVEPGLPPALGDADRQWQILTNLVSNALKFSDPGDPVEVEVTANEGELMVKVRDHGIGIEAENIPKLFKRFGRLPRPKGKRAAGSGLGLFICKGMVEGQGGRIWVSSTPGEGSEFTYTVPVPGE